MTRTNNLVLFHAPRTRSVRVRWLLEEMDLKHKLEPVQFNTRPAGDAAYEKIHPLRKVPALKDGETTVLESVAIMQYVLGRYGPSSLAVTPDETAYGHYLQMLHFGESGMVMPISLLLAHTTLLPEDKRDPVLAGWAKTETAKVLDYLSEAGLGENTYLAADRFTAADISVCYMFYLLKIIGQFDDAPANLKRYFKHLTQRPSWIIASSNE
jgi:glutathione S-transferase